MRKKMKLFVIVLFVFVVCVNSTSIYAKWDYYVDSNATDSGTNVINSYPGTPEACYLFGAVSLTGTSAAWLARLTGAYAYKCEDAFASFGKNGSDTNIMSKTYFVAEDEYVFEDSSWLFSVYNAKTCTGNW